jgi:hypothetical protein
MRPELPSIGPGLKPKDRSLAWTSLTSSGPSAASLAAGSAGAGWLSIAGAGGADAMSMAGVPGTLAAGDGADAAGAGDVD